MRWRGETGLQFFVGYLGLVAGGTVTLATEISDTAYSRRPVTFASLGDGRLTVQESSSYSFGPAATDWGLVTGVGLFADGMTASSPLVTWAVHPTQIRAGQTYVVPPASLSLLIREQGYRAAGDVLGVTVNGADIVATQAVLLNNSALTAVSSSTTSTDSGSTGMTLTQLNALLAQLMRNLPTQDPVDGTSLWNNAGLLALSQSAA